MNLQRGISLYLVLLIIFVTLATALGLTTLAAMQLKAVRGLGNSVSAFFAADSGLERELYTNSLLGSEYEQAIDSERRYKVKVIARSATCLGVDRCIESSGIYRGVRRAIRITR